MSTVAVRQPAWLEHAWAELGQHEVAGSGSNPRIAEYIRRVGHPDVARDDTPWCAAFVGACLERAGVQGTGSLLARSYLGWGSGCGEFALGAIAVLSRGSDPGAGHVGFLVGATADRIVLLGGNQSDAVSIESFARSRLIELRLPLSDAQAAGEPTAAATFEWSLARVLELEGGYSDDPFDPGGPTNKGITLGDYAAFVGKTVEGSNYGRLKAELRRIPDSLVARIYEQRYWRPACCASLPRPLAHFHFDCAVNQGVRGAARMLQSALGVEVDAEIGPLTLGAARSVPAEQTLQRYADIRRQRYRSLQHFWRFGRGWLRRVDKVLEQSLGLLSGAAVVPTGQAASSRTDVNPPQQQEKQIMPQSETPEFPPADIPAKWWGSSLTIWGAFITAVSTVAPTVLAVFGFDISTALIQQLGGDVVTVAQALGGLVGTIMTIIGRSRAALPLVRRPVSLRV